MICNFNGISIHYEVYGVGKPLLLLNGIMMSTKSWEMFIDDLSQNRQLILMDFIDQGQSQRLDIEYNHTVQVECVKFLLDHLKIKQTDLFGISYGGQIAIQVALKYPQRIDRLCLSNTSSNTSTWLKHIGYNWNIASQDPLQYYLTTIPTIYSPQFYTKNQSWFDKRKEVLLNVFSNTDFISAMRRLTQSSQDYDVSDKIHLINHKTLIIGCEQDYITPIYQQQELKLKIKNSELVIIPEAGHAIMYEKPELFVLLVNGFFSLKNKEYQL